MEDGHFNLAFEESVPQGGGTSDFNELINRPKKDGVEMTGDTNIVIPTKTSDLTNDAGYQTSAQVDTKVAAEATARAAAITAVRNEIPDVIDNVTSTSTTNALSAKQGKLLNDRITNIDSRGRYLSTWNATTGEPGTEPEVIPYAYRTGDYFIVATVGATNYRPTGTQYTGTPSTVVETETVSPNDTYLYDGTTWELIHTEIPQIAIDENLSATSRNAVWNSTITNALGDKVDKVTGKQLSTEDYTSAEKTKLSGVETGAEVNIIETVKVNGTALTPDSSRAVDVVAATPSDLALKQDVLTAGDNITISNNEISATDTTYTAGDNITISNNEISADVPELLTTTGQSTTAGMTQKAITDALASAGGGVKVLTTADYNWNFQTQTTTNPNSIALWLLDEGVYTNGSSLNILTSRTNRVVSGRTVALVSGKDTSGDVTTVIISPDDAEKSLSERVNSSGSSLLSVNILSIYINNLTTTSAGYALDARQGKVLKDLIDSLIIKGSGAPTTSTVGTVGKLYEDTTNGDLYQCTAVSGSTYTWEEVGGGGGGGDVSFTDLFTDGSTQTRVKIGANAVSSGDNSVAIGGANDAYPARATGDNSAAIGHNARAFGLFGVAVGNSSFVGSSTSEAIAVGNFAEARANLSVAAGSRSKATQIGEFSIGDATRTDLYNNTGYRLLTNVHDPVNDHDAATKGYVDALITQIQALEARIAALEGNA